MHEGVRSAMIECVSDACKDGKIVVIKAGAPEEVVNELWFNIFCQKFAHELMTVLEEEE